MSSLQTLFTPSELQAKGSDVRFDMTGIPAAGSPRRSKAKVLVAPLSVGRHPVQLLLKGTLTTDGITHMTGEYGDNYSFGLRIASDDDQSALEQLQEQLLAEQVPGESREWETRDLFKNGVLYLKCKTDVSQKRFDFASNVKLAPKKKTDELLRDMGVQVTVKPSAYYSLDSSARGLSLAIVSVEFLKEERQLPTSA